MLAKTLFLWNSLFHLHVRKIQLFNNAFLQKTSDSALLQAKYCFLHKIVTSTDAWFGIGFSMAEQTNPYEP